MIFNPAWPFLRLLPDEDSILGYDQQQMTLLDSSATVPVPLQVANLQAWFDAQTIGSLWQDTTLATPVTANNDPVGGWVDLSGTGNTLTQGTGANKGVYVTGGISGFPSVQNPDGLRRLTKTFGSAINQPITVFLVVKASSNTNFDNYYDAPGALPTRIVLYQSGVQYSFYAGTDMKTSVAPNTNAHIIVGIYNGASSKGYVDGGAAVASGNAGANAWGGIQLMAGQGAGAPGLYGEFLVYAAALTVAQVNLIAAYLAAKWGLTWTTAT